MAMNKFGGVNDMPDGFTKTSLGKRVYNLWFGILRRWNIIRIGNRAEMESEVGE